MQICLLQSKLGLICENLCSYLQEHSSRDNELMAKVHSDSFSHFVWKISPFAPSAGSPQSISQVEMLEFVHTANAEDWTVNSQVVRSHSCSPHAVCHGSRNLSRVVYSRLWLRKANADQSENLWFEASLTVRPPEWFTLQANWQIPLILQSQTINNYVCLKHSFRSCGTVRSGATKINSLHLKMAEFSRWPEIELFSPLIVNGTMCGRVALVRVSCGLSLMLRPLQLDCVRLRLLITPRSDQTPVGFQADHTREHRKLWSHDSISAAASESLRDACCLHYDRPPLHDPCRVSTHCWKEPGVSK